VLIARTGTSEKRGANFYQICDQKINLRESDDWTGQAHYARDACCAACASLDWVALGALDGVKATVLRRIGGVLNADAGSGDFELRVHRKYNPPV
jgi:hypothetical protein